MYNYHNYHADNAGHVPQAGDFVAYNYSGQIATGWITKIGKTKRGHVLYHIQQVVPQEGHKSTVRGGPKCVLVLERGDNDTDNRT